MKTLGNQDMNQELRELRLSRAFLFVKRDKTALKSVKKAYAECLQNLDTQIADCLRVLDDENL